MIYLVRLWAWFRCWFGRNRLSSKMSAMEFKVERLRKEVDRNDTKLREYYSDALKWQKNIEKATELNKKVNLALEISIQELENAKQITIPGLVAANKVLISRWESEIQVHAIRSASLHAGSEITRE